MQLIRKNGTASNILRAKLRSSATGNGLTGLTFSSSGLIISTICDNEATATNYTAAGSTTETITTLGTFAAPTSTKCRFKEVDATNQPGVYELQFADARFAVSSAKTLRIAIVGATNLLDKEILVQLSSVDPDSAAAFMTGVNNLAPPTNWNLDSIDSSGRRDIGKALGTAITLDANNVMNVSAKYVGGTLQTARDIGGAVPAIAPASVGGLMLAGVSNAGTTSFAGGINSQITDASGASMARLSFQNTIIGLLPTALVGGRMDASVGGYQSGQSPLQPTVAGRTLDVSAGGEAGLDWANIGSPTVTVAFTNSTIGTVTLTTTATNLTNAPTSGDLTATMKASVTTAATAATPVAASLSGITFPSGFSTLTVAAIQSGLSTVTTAQVKAQADQALSDAGVTSARMGYLDRFNGMIVLSGAAYIFTTAALANAPAGGGGGGGTENTWTGLESLRSGSE